MARPKRSWNKKPDVIKHLETSFRQSPWLAFVPGKPRELAEDLDIHVMNWIGKMEKLRTVREVRAHPRYRLSVSREKGVVRFFTPFQQEMLDALGDPEVDEFFGIGPNRGGKSIGGALMCAFFAHGFWPDASVKMPKPPVQVWACFPDWTNHGIKITKPMMSWALGQVGVIWHAKERYFNVCSHILERDGQPCRKCTEPSQVFLIPYDRPTRFQGGSPAFIWDDEAPTEEIFMEQRARIGGEHPLKIAVTVTPLAEAAWMYNEIVQPWEDEGRPPRIRFAKPLKLEDNPYISGADVEKIYASYQNRPDQLAARTRGEWSMVSGKVYPMLDRRVHVVEDFEIPGVHRPVLDGEQPWTLYRSHDPGLRAFAVVLWVAVSPAGLCFVYREMYAKNRSIKELCVDVYRAQTKLERERRWGSGSKDAIVWSTVDPSVSQRDFSDKTRRVDRYAQPFRQGSSPDWQEKNKRYGIVFLPGNNDLETGVDAMTEAFSFELDAEGDYRRPPKYRFFSSCPNVWREHCRYVYPDHNPSSPRGPREKPRKKDDHGCDALRYLEASYGGPKFREPRPVDFREEEYAVSDEKTGY